MEPVSDSNSMLDDPDAPWGGFKTSGDGGLTPGNGLSCNAVAIFRG